MNYIAVNMATVSQNFRRVRFLESVDVSTYHAIRNYDNLGLGKTPLTGPNPLPISPLLDMMSLTGRKKGV